jgi:diguanylate cyclase (GGDEF)-like protein
LSVTVIETYETQRKRYEEKIKEMAQKDFLTGIYNRRAFFHLAKSCLNQNRGVLMIDIDYFKKINDTYGHAAGDVVLKEVTKRIQSLLRDEDIFARIGGEEFVILLNSVNKESLIKKAKEINEKIKNEKIENINVTISVGGYLFKDKNIEIAMKKADEALYKAKEKRDSVVIF